MHVYFISRRMIKTVLIALAAATVIIMGLAFLKDQGFFAASKSIEPYYQGRTGQKAVAFTFNVDWGEEFIPQTLNLLKENNIKATFFITGRWAAKNADLTKKIADAGHVIGNHGAQHAHVKQLGIRGIEEEILGCEMILSKITGKKTTLYAPAFGEFDQKIAATAERLGYQVIMWSLDTIDWQQPDPGTIVQRVLPKIHNDAIILMHPTEPTLQALPIMIKKLKEEGYRFETVPNIIKTPVENDKSGEKR